VQSSAGELSVAQGALHGHALRLDQRPHRRYLASGRPAVVSDTGFGADLRASPALRAFGTPEQAVAACCELAVGDPGELAGAARQLAADRFSTRAVLPPVLELLGAA
jgi:hypothetical protein